MVSGNESCPSDYPSEVIYDLFMGTRGFCDCIDRDYQFFLDRQCNKGKNGSEKSALCYAAPGMPPIVQSNIKGIKVCGKRAGRNFRNAVRPDYTTGNCPEGYRGCYLTPSEDPLYKEATICYHEENDEEEDNHCPITGITFDLTQVPADIAGSYREISIGVPNSPITSIYYTKANFQLPITSTKISFEQPCINP